MLKGLSPFPEVHQASLGNLSFTNVYQFCEKVNLNANLLYDKTVY
ncbi:hypothetical protein GCM10011459_21220 [Limosilactobacillus caviae]|uniref:Uncharacterized protein n=1 Tax=Limosilactobacillus caviae TaxID=1769424 RepID=A0ABQ2CA74_9LACO|nr:hypothetical protein GCM10011459_21220 [Limosilactobacillus caviae]